MQDDSSTALLQFCLSLNVCRKGCYPGNEAVTRNRCREENIAGNRTFEYDFAHVANCRKSDIFNEKVKHTVVC